jgi:indolepyruvate decarboxylase
MNNNGYTIERLLSDNPQDEFNNIASWNYSKLPEVFEGDCFVYRAKTNKDFDEALKCAMSEQENKMCYIEVFLPTLDVPYLCGKCFSKNLIGQTI